MNNYEITEVSWEVVSQEHTINRLRELTGSDADGWGVHAKNGWWNFEGLSGTYVFKSKAGITRSMKMAAKENEGTGEFFHYVIFQRPNGLWEGYVNFSKVEVAA